MWKSLNWVVISSDKMILIRMIWCVSILIPYMLQRNLRRKELEEGRHIQFVVYKERTLNSSSAYF